MCITFVYFGCNDNDSDYSLILASNRDEFYDRPALNMGPWADDPEIYAGRDMEAGRGSGTWLAVSPAHKKIGVLHNLTGLKKENSKSRGKIVVDYAKSETSLTEYINSVKDYMMDCNGFNFIAIEIKEGVPDIYSYNNATNTILKCDETFQGFGNSLPDKPLKKVEIGKKKLERICTQYNKIENKKILIEELVKLLKCEDKNLPDPELEKRHPEIYRNLSSIFVTSVGRQYGTRAHTLVIVTKTGEMDLIEISLKSPIIDPFKDEWETNEFNFKIGT